MQLSLPLLVRKRERKRGRERVRKRDRVRERCRIFLKGMTGALAPFSYLVDNVFIRLYQN
jgi:hypothetical protein